MSHILVLPGVSAAGNALVQALGAGHLGSLAELRQVVRESFAVEEFVPKG